MPVLSTLVAVLPTLARLFLRGTPRGSTRLTLALARRAAALPVVPVIAIVLSVAPLSPRRAAAQQAESPTGVSRVVPPSPNPDGFIHDGSRVLSPAARGELNQRITAVQSRTGGDIGVAIVTDLRGYAPVDVGVAIFRAWKIGKIDSLGSARRDLGALLLIVPKELAPDRRGECWITTGLGAEGTLIDSHAGAICRDRVIPALRVREYAAAVDSGITGIAVAFDRAVADEKAARDGDSLSAGSDDSAPQMALSEQPEPGPGRTFPWFWVVGVAIAGSWIIAAVAAWKRYQRRKPRPCPAGHGLMTRLDEAADDGALAPGQRAEERVGSVDYDVWACASCTERIVIPYSRWSSYGGCPKCQARTLSRSTVTATAATQFSTGLEETTLDCAFCRYHHVTQRVTPVLPPPPPPSSSSGSAFSSGGSSSSASFGGSGRTAGGGGGSSY